MSPRFNCCGRLVEFFEVNGSLSMRNLTVFITIVVASVIVLYLAFTGNLSSEMFASYLLAGGGVYGFGKWQEEKTTRAAALPKSAKGK